MPKVFIDDITKISKDEWREKRKSGIGGSDVGAILGLNKYQSVFDIFYTKIGTKNLRNISEKSQITMEIGNCLENLVADLFQKKHLSMQVLVDNTMYQHSTYEFMLANIDRKIILPDKTYAILECKTLANANEWKSTDFCKGVKGTCPLSYEYQVRHYMAVLNIDLAIIAGLDIVTKDLYVVYVMRDKEIEKKIIDVEAEFWELVNSKTIPTFSQQFNRISTAIRADAFKRFYGADKTVVYQLKEKDEFDIFNHMNELILKQQFYSNEMQKVKEEKEELAMDLFLMCERRGEKKPSRIELKSITDNVEVTQYISLSDTTSVDFDVKKFIDTYNTRFHMNLTYETDVHTAILLCYTQMPDKINQFMSINDKSARFYFSKRKVKLKSKKNSRNRKSVGN